MTALVTVEQYRRQTHELTAQAGEIEAALELATAQIESFLGRVLAYGEQTEWLQIGRDRLLYPTRTPLASETAGRVSDTIVQLATYGDPLGSTTALGRSAYLTYEGGWTAESLPPLLRQAIIATAQTAFLPSDPGANAGVRLGREQRALIAGYRHRVVVQT